MTSVLTRRFKYATTLLLAVVMLFGTGSCSTAPAVKDRAAFMDESEAALAWFEGNVPGLRAQIDRSAGYVVFPSVGQWGILLTGGKFGRGTLNRPDHSQIGWAAINTGSIGLQAGVQGFKLLLVIEDRVTLNKFMDNQLSGGATGVAVLGEAGGSATAPFQNGIAMYQGANTGLMAGVNVGLDWIRYEPLKGEQ
ncbi:MAG: lipid-binding SYLF domain-containing protein [Planctomycetota bacterium]|jgi:lipid-binding SYLF domain-containing protein